MLRHACELLHLHSGLLLEFVYACALAQSHPMRMQAVPLPAWPILAPFVSLCVSIITARATAINELPGIYRYTLPRFADPAVVTALHLCQ